MTDMRLYAHRYDRGIRIFWQRVYAAHQSIRTHSGSLARQNAGGFPSD